MRKIFIATTALVMIAGGASAQVVVKDSGPMAGPVVDVVPAAPESVREYVLTNPRPPVVLEGEIRQGYVVPADVELIPVPDQPDYVYFYSGDNRPVIVRAQDRSVVYVESGGSDVVAVEREVPDELIGYIRKNPVDPVVLEGEVEVGYEVPADVVLQPVDGYQGYSYIYYDGRPYVVDTATRKVVYLAR